MAQTSENNKRIAKNTIVLYIRMLVQMVIGLYTSRVILNALGVTDFGIYNVVGSVTAMLAFINSSMSNATMRFITYEEGRGNSDRLNVVFCTSMNIHILIAIFTLLILNTVGVWFLFHKMVIAPERLNAALWVLQFSIVACIINIISVPYNASIIAHEKMGAFAIISLTEQVVTLGLALALPSYSGDRLILYGVMIMLVQILLRILYGLYCKRNFIECRYKFLIDKKLMKEMATFAGWTLNGNIAWLGYTQGLNILINMFFGPTVNAARGIALTVQTKITNFCNNFQLAVDPQITKTYSINNYNAMHNLILKSSKFSYYMMLLLALPVFIEAEEILRLWLNIVPEHTVNFVRLILLCSVVDIFRNPMNTAIHATGSIKTYQLWEATTLLAIVPLAYLALKLGCRVELVFIIQLVVFILVQLERIFIVCPRIYMKKNIYVSKLLVPSLYVTVISLLIPAILLYVYPIETGNIFQLFFYIITIFLVTLVTIFLVGLNATEKKIIYNFVQTKIKRK